MSGQNISYRELLNMPLQAVRRSVAQDFFSKKLNLQAFDKHMSALHDYVAQEKSEQLTDFDIELELARKTLQTGTITQEPRTDLPAFQLLWGSVQAVAALDANSRAGWDDTFKNKCISETPVWAAVNDSHDAKKERSATIMHANAEIRSKTLSVGYQEPQEGYPSIAYYFQSENNYINEDPIWKLIMGVEGARAATMHEIAHGQGSNNFSPKLQILHDKIKEMRDAKPLKEWDKNEQMAFAKLRAEWNLRWMMYDEAENNYANQFAANKGQNAGQDYARSLNFVEAILVDTIETKADGKEKIPDTNQKLLNIKNILRYAFFQRNGFFDDNDEGWAEIGVDLDLLVDSVEGDSLTAHDILDDIIKKCNQIAHSQPEPNARMGGNRYIKTRIEECEAERLRINDEIFEQYIAPFMPEIMQQVENKAAAIKDAIQGGKIILIDGMGETDLAKPLGDTPGEVKGIPDEKPKEPKVEKPRCPSLSDAPKDSTQKAGKKPSTDSLKGGDFKTAKQFIAQNRPYINKLSKLWREIQKKFLETRDEVSDQRDYTGDLANLDLGSVYDRFTREIARQPVSATDYAHIGKEAPQRTAYPPTQVDIYIDNSSSMNGAKLRMACAAGLSISESGRPVNIVVNMATLGCFDSDSPHYNTCTQIASPSDDLKVIGQRIDSLISGRGLQGDHILPALKHSFDYVTNSKQPNHIVGTSHVIIISDTNFCDMEPGSKAAKFIEMVGRKCQQMTLDFVIVQNKDSRVIPIVNRINRGVGHKHANYRHVEHIEGVGEALTSLLTDRLRNMREADGIPLSEKQRIFEKFKSHNPLEDLN